MIPAHLSLFVLLQKQNAYPYLQMLSITRLRFEFALIYEIVTAIFLAPQLPCFYGLKYIGKGPIHITPPTCNFEFYGGHLGFFNRT